MATGRCFFRPLVLRMDVWRMEQAEYDSVMVRKMVRILVTKGCIGTRSLGGLFEEVLETLFHERIA